MASETSVLKFHKVCTGQESRVGDHSQVQWQVRITWGNCETYLCHSPTQRFWNWFKVSQIVVFFKCSPGKSNVQPGFSTHGILLLWEVPWMKSQKPEIQALKSKINSWAMLYARFWASFLHLLIPSSNKEFLTCSPQIGFVGSVNSF